VTAAALAQQVGDEVEGVGVGDVPIFDDETEAGVLAQPEHDARQEVVEATRVLAADLRPGSQFTTEPGEESADDGDTPEQFRCAAYERIPDLLGGRAENLAQRVTDRQERFRVTPDTGGLQHGHLRGAATLRERLHHAALASPPVSPDDHQPPSLAVEHLGGDGVEPTQLGLAIDQRDGYEVVGAHAPGRCWRCSSSAPRCPLPTFTLQTASYPG
jgi:hypothetical protein